MYFTREDIDHRRERLRAAWDPMLETGEAVLIHAGEPIQKPGGLDQTYPFLPHPAYFWLTGRRRETEVLLYSKDGGWTEFQKEIPVAEAIWEGERRDLLVSEKGKAIHEIDAYIREQGFTTLYSLTQTPRPEGKAFHLRTALDRVRRKKDAAEIRLVRELAVTAGFGYRKISEILRPGISENEIRIAYESEIFRKGAHTVPYDTIVGSGPNAAILHALPTQRTVGRDEYVLVDAGADIYDYCVDITRTYYSSGKMSQQHKDLYQLVLKAHTECIALSKPGAFWRDVHGHAATVITEGLLQLGILQGSLTGLLEKEVVSAFFPHGVGHLFGLRVRDTGHEENLEPKTYFGARLRVDIELEENHMLTVEPGCYFIPALLHSAPVQEKYREDINWAELEKWKEIGGVRIEDNILVGPGGNENLTAAIPKLQE